MAAAPVIVFAYKRPQLLEATLRSLAANDLAAQSHLHIYCDGPKADAADQDLAAIQAVRTIARNASGFAGVRVVAAERNKGLARSVIDGVSEVLQQHDRAIVVEDDVALSPFFLRFMNDALERYATDEKVWSVGSWSYFAEPGTHADNFFVRFPDSIAWGTWRRSWQHFEQDGRTLVERLRATGKDQALEADGRVDYFGPMLQQQLEGRVDSWAIRWTASCVLHGGLNLFPRTSLSKHMGFGEGATHETGELDYNKDLALASSPVPVAGQDIIESSAALDQWVAYVQHHFQPASGRTLKRLVWRALPAGLRQWYVRLRSSGGGRPQDLAFEPVSRVFGVDRGLPVDRHYIERFLASQRSLVSGTVMEIAEAQYTRRFASGQVRSLVLRTTGDAAPDVVIGDLTRPDTLPAGTVDAFICTQTLNFIFDVRRAVEGLHAVLRPGGHALVTVAGLCQVSRYDAERWGDHWRFMPQSIERLFHEVFGADNVQVTVYGNSYAAACLMKGFATEECDTALLDRPDPDYPVVIAIKARRS